MTGSELRTTKGLRERVDWLPDDAVINKAMLLRFRDDINTLLARVDALEFEMRERSERSTLTFDNFKKAEAECEALKKALETALAKGKS